MGHHVLPGNPPIELTLRRSGRARRISLRISGIDGRVTLTLPSHVSDGEGLSFAQEKSSWLRKNLTRKPALEVVGIGTELAVEGQNLTIVQGSAARVTKDESLLYVPGPPERTAARVLGWLKARARDRLASASDHCAAQIGRHYSRLTLRDTRSRWGSCTHDGNLMYSWRLILAPPDVLDYVAAHEVAHLVEMNHSSNFWSIVNGLHPGYDKPRRWLRDHGAELHRYKFDADRD